jgi:hypothetical protein
VFDGPQPFDRAAVRSMKTPDNWREELPGQAEVQVVPLTNKQGEGHGDIGWCTAATDIQGPETEVMCGGVNSKLTTHAGVWRQGNLLHFGFQSPPSRLNGNGKALLLNCIAYISRFRDDRPIAQGVSIWSGQPKRALRRYLHYTLDAAEIRPADLGAQFAAPLRERIAAMSQADARKFVHAEWDYLRATDGEGYVVDADAKALQVAVDASDLPGKLARLLDDPQHSDAALHLLQRVVPAGPGAKADAAAWKSWIATNQQYLFYSEAGGYVWLVDHLAKVRSVPTATLRGPARATVTARNG